MTLAAWTIMIGSAFVVLLTFEMISNLHTLQTREAVQGFLSEPPGDGLGLSVEGAIAMMRTLGMVAGGCAAAAGILGYQVLRRSKPARIALTVLAVPLLLSGMVTGGFLSSLVAASAFLLWLPPARDWFAGREPVRRVPTEAGPARGSNGPGSQRSGETPAWPPPLPAPPSHATEARPVTGFGSAPTAGAPAPTAPTAPLARGSAWLPASSRPSTVIWACALTWLFAGLGAITMVAGLAYLAVSPDSLIADMRAQNPELADAGLTDRMILAVAFVTGGALIVWAVAAIVLAFLLYRGVSWARVVLLVSTGGALGLLALGALSQLVLMVPFLAAAMTMTLLLRPETAAWTRR